MANFAMHAAHGRHWIIAADKPCHGRIDFGVILVLVRDQLLLQKLIKIRQLGHNCTRREDREPVGRGADPLQYGPELFVFGLQSVKFCQRQSRPPLSRPMHAKGPQGVQNDGNIDRFLKDGPGQRRQITECRGTHRYDRQTHTPMTLSIAMARERCAMRRFREAVQPIDEEYNSGSLG